MNVNPKLARRGCMHEFDIELFEKCLLIDQRLITREKKILGELGQLGKNKVNNENPISYVETRVL